MQPPHAATPSHHRYTYCAFYAKKKPTDSTPVGFFFAFSVRYCAQRIPMSFHFCVNIENSPKYNTVSLIATMARRADLIPFHTLSTSSILQLV